MWRVVADPYSYSRWVTGTAAITAADPHWPAPGARLYHRFGPRLLHVRDHTTVCEAESGSRLVLAARARPFGTVRAELTIHPDGTGARIVLREVLRGGLGARLPRVGHAVQRRRLRRSVQALAQIAEDAPAG